MNISFNWEFNSSGFPDDSFFERQNWRNQWGDGWLIQLNFAWWSISFEYRRNAPEVEE